MSRRARSARAVATRAARDADVHDHDTDVVVTERTQPVHPPVGRQPADPQPVVAAVRDHAQHEGDPEERGPDPGRVAAHRHQLGRHCGGGSHHRTEAGQTQPEEHRAKQRRRSGTTMAAKAASPAARHPASTISSPAFVTCGAGTGPAPTSSARPAVLFTAQQPGRDQDGPDSDDRLHEPAAVPHDEPTDRLDGVRDPLQHPHGRLVAELSQTQPRGLVGVRLHVRDRLDQDVGREAQGQQQHATSGQTARTAAALQTRSPPISSS